ncbi:CCR4-Not complex component, Not1, partial [Opisthorchis viverrini]
MKSVEVIHRCYSSYTLHTSSCREPDVISEPVLRTPSKYEMEFPSEVPTPSPAGAQIGRQFGSSTPSAFGLAMKSGAPPLGSGAAQSQAQQQGRQVVPPTGLHPYQQPDLATAGLFASNTDDAFSRSTALSSFTGRLNQTGLVQHGPLSRKPSEALAYPMDHSPVALSFANEPIKIEMSKEAEAEAYGFFQKLLKGISTPDEMFKTVCEYATQGSLSQRKLLDGILRMLADEVSQYLPDYPEPMLPLIADLYGSILAASTQLLSIRALSMLWRALLTRIHSLTPEATETPLFRAVILILLKAKHAYTQFFNLPSCLVTCPVFKYFPHELQEYLLSAEMLANNYVRSQQVAGSGGSKAAITTSGTAFHPAGQLLGQHQSSTGVAAVSQQPSSSSHLQQQQPIGLSMYATQPEPPFKPPDPPEESISDRIYFLFNNVSQANVKEKSAELVEILSEERLLPWFAFYLIGKRIPVEHTFHDLFAVVLDHVQEQITNLRQPIMHELLRNIKVLLRNMRKDRDDMQARMTLKNLGNFLGLITLARNKPLLHDDLNVKDLVYEAYHKGPVPAQYVVPFVARIVKNATNSIVFRPPNPWTMAILKVFRELYDLNDVKDCIRFEIELLYRNFSLNVEDVPMAHFLRDRGHAANLEVQLCFFVLSEIPTTISSTVASTTTPMLTSGADANTTTTTSATVVTDLVPTTMTSALPAQQQMLSMLAAFQKQQTSVSGQQTGIGALDLASTPVSTNVSQPMYSASGLDLASMLQSGAGSSNNRALVLAAALAASQSQKQQQFGPQCGAVGGGGGAAGAAAPTSALSLHQKQLAAAMAALQQQQQQQQHFQHPSGASSAYPSGSLQIQHLSATASDSTVEVPGGNLRYEEVSIQTIRACLNLDDLIAAAAASSRASAGGTLTSSGGNNPTQAAIALLQSNPRLRNLIEPAITRAINELTTPVFERCARITVTTVAAIVRKDFALDPDPNRMRYAAHQMVRHLAAGMSLITAREALGMSLVTGLKNIMLAEVQSASGQEKEAVQRLAHLVVAKTMHTCLAYMQKSVAEKAVNDVDKKLDSDIKLRTELGPRRFLEQASSQLAMQQANMPESLRLTVGGLTQSEMSVYEEFGRVIPGFAPSPAGSVSSSALGLGQPASPSTGGGGGSTTAAQVAVYLQQQKQAAELSSAGRIQRQLSTASSAAPGGVSLLKPLMGTTHSTPMAGLWDKIIGQIERHLTFISSWLSSPNDPMIRSLRCLIDTMHLAKSNRDPAVAVTVIATMVKSFLEHYRPTAWCEQPRGLETMEHLKEAHMLTLRHMLSSDQASFGYAWVTRQVTQTWIQLDGGSVGKERQKPSSLAAGETAASGGSGPEQNSDAAAVVSTTAGNIATSKTEKSSTSETKGDGNDGFYGWNSTQSSALRFDGVDSRLHSIKWNWEAFAELLKVHVIYLSQVDSYLAQEVAAGHPGAITFVIDLLDHFVLPCPTGTAVGAAAAAAASYARSSVASTTGAGAGTGGPTGQAGSTGSTTGSAAVQYPAAGSAQSSLVPPKRGFTVLNEYDLWSTLEAMRTRVAHLNSALSARPSPASLLDPLGLRLRFACARVRGLLDLGLLEQSPLFLTSITPSPISALYAGCSQAREFDDPPNLQEKVELLMRNWVEIYQSPRQRDPATIEAMLAQLSQIGVLPNMDTLTRFLRLATIFVIERALKQLKLQEQHPQQPPQQQVPGMPPSVVPLSGGAGVSSNVSVARVVTYVELDAYARLISIIIKRSGEHHTEKPNIKITLLNKVLGIIVGILLQEHEVRRDWFHPMPFERILIMLFVELHSSYVLTGEVVEMPAETVTEAPPSGTAELGTDKANAAAKTPSRGLSNLGLQQQLPLVFCHLLHCLRPEKAAAFVFSWLEMLAHRWFVGRILAAPGPIELRAAYQAMYAQLLVDLLKFLGYFLQNALMPKPIQCLYKATLRLFLVLIHDFPEFVSDYYALFCDVVPSNSIQMRNLILSALPKRGIPSADPLQAPPVDNLASLDDPTGYCMEAGSRLPELMRRDIDAYHATRAPLKLLSELVTMLRRADDILPPPPPPPFVYHPQQQACHQQALAAYAAALVANDTGAAVPLPVTVSTAGKSDDKQASDEGGDQASGAQTSLGMPTTSASETNEGSSVSTDSTGQSGPRSTTNTSVGAVAAASPLLWGVRATQQLATFGMADGMHYNVELMTNLTLYVCITAIRNLREKGMPLNMSTIAHTPQMDIIQSLVLNLDNEGRYLLLNCMANQLRYPNSHTYYFSYTILYLFSEQSKEQVKEQISRVLMERLIVNRPHPWGLLMTSAELLRNPAYRFWEHEFARCNPEIEAIVTIVARSCIPNFQIPTMSSSNNSGQQQPSLRSNAAPSSAVATTDRRRQGSPLTHGSPSATDACPGAMRVSRALNSFVPDIPPEQDTTKLTV